jgi:hypothetical protein
MRSLKPIVVSVKDDLEVDAGDLAAGSANLFRRGLLDGGPLTDR